LALAMVWGFAVEPSLLTVSGIEYSDKRLPQDMDGVRVVYISDIHAGPFYSPQAVERLTKKIAELEPDMLLFGGDIMPRPETMPIQDSARMAKAFAALEPKLGKYAVYGNHDIWTPLMKKTAEEILSGGGFTILENSAVEIEPGFYIAGTAPWPMDGENSVNNYADVSKVTWTLNNNAFVLLMAHEPAQIRKDSQYSFALQLSGHTHGGQVAIPFMSPIKLRGGMEIYKSGFYKLNNATMFVSRGIGTSVVRLRLFVPPEIVVLTLWRK
jgi:uncharacterized protein